jgi:hypothetical protein
MSVGCFGNARSSAAKNCQPTLLKSLPSQLTASGNAAKNDLASSRGSASKIDSAIR